MLNLVSLSTIVNCFILGRESSRASLLFANQKSPDIECSNAKAIRKAIQFFFLMRQLKGLFSKVFSAQFRFIFDSFFVVDIMFFTIFLYSFIVYIFKKCVSFITDFFFNDQDKRQRTSTPNSKHVQNKSISTYVYSF